MFTTAKAADPADYDCTQLHFDESVLTTPSVPSTVSTFRVIDVIVFKILFQVEDAFVFYDASIAKGDGLVFIGKNVISAFSLKLLVLPSSVVSNAFISRNFVRS